MTSGCTNSAAFAVEMPYLALSQSKKNAYRWSMSSGKHVSRSAKRDLGLFARLRLRVSCMFGNHEPNRNKVRRTTGVYYVGVCRHCGVAIRKRHGYGWKASSPDEAREDQAALPKDDKAT